MKILSLSRVNPYPPTDGGKENEHFLVSRTPEEFAQKTIFLIENRDIAFRISYNAKKN